MFNRQSVLFVFGIRVPEYPFSKFQSIHTQSLTFKLPCPICYFSITNVSCYLVTFQQGPQNFGFFYQCKIKINFNNQNIMFLITFPKLVSPPWLFLVLFNMSFHSRSQVEKGDLVSDVPSMGQKRHKRLHGSNCVPGFWMNALKGSPHVILE